MKKFIVLIALATFFIGGTQTTFAQSKKKANIAAFLGGVKLNRATPNQLQRAFNRALNKNPNDSARLLQQVLNSPKLNGNSGLAMSFALQALSKNPSQAADIFRTASGKVQGSDLVNLFQNVIASPSISSSVALELYNQARSSLGDSPLLSQLTSSLLKDFPALASSVTPPSEGNTSGPVNSNEV